MKIGTLIRDKDGNTYTVENVRSARTERHGTVEDKSRRKDYFIVQIDDDALAKFDATDRNARLNGTWVQDYYAEKCAVVEAVA